MANRHDINKTDVKKPFALRLQQTVKLWQKKNEEILKKQEKLLKLWASGFFEGQYERTHLINLMDRGVFTIVPFLVEGNPKVMVETLIANMKPWAFTTQLALNFFINKMKLADRVFIPVAVNSMFGAGITRVFTEYDRVISLNDEVIKAGVPTIKVIHDTDYIGDPIAKTRDDFILEGDIYKLPTDYAKDLFAGKDSFGNEIADYIFPDCKISTEFSPERIYAPGFAYNINRYNIREFTTFIDVYLFDENVTVTIMPEHMKAKILRTVEEDGPNESPYDYLGYKYLPNCSVPIPPAWFWHDLDVSTNIVANTAREQAESQKDLIFSDDKKLLGKVTNAKNMDVMFHPNPKEGIRKESVGGMNTEALPYLKYVETAFNKSGGTSEIMGGRGTDSPTLGQEKMQFQNASRIVNNMYTRFHEFMTSVIKKLAWRVWTDPTVYIPVIKEIPGVGELPEIFSQADKVGDFYDFVFKITPYSTQRMSPEMKYQRLMQFAAQWILPTLPHAQTQGAEFDIPEATKTMAEYIGLDNFNQMYRTAFGSPLQTFPYTMQPVGGKKQQSQGQGNDSFGALIGSRESNSSRAQGNEDLKVGV